MAGNQTTYNQFPVAETIYGKILEEFTQEPIQAEEEQQRTLVYDQPAPLDATHIKHRAAKRLAEIGMLEADRLGSYFGPLRWPEDRTGTRRALELYIAGYVAYNGSEDEELKGITDQAFGFLKSNLTEEIAVEGIRERLELCRQSEIEIYKDKEGTRARIPSRGRIDDNIITTFVDDSIKRARRLQIRAVKL
jgi:hypothetical protein